METYDLIIIGSGSGNAIPEYFSDKKIALIEKSTFGGTCLNVGCIPSKMFVLPGDTANLIKESEKLGVHAKLEHVDWEAIRDRVFNRIDPIAAGGKEYRATGTPNLELIEGTASFMDNKRIQVGERTLTAPAILIAAGSRPFVPPIPGIEDVTVHTSDNVMRLEKLPQALAIIGGGFIAAEMGHVFSSYGSEVTLFNRSASLLSTEDHEVSERFIEEFSKKVSLRLGELPQKIEQTTDGITIHTESGTLTVDVLLAATGRTSNSDLLALDNTDIETDPKGRIPVNTQMETAVKGIWAIGDIANPFQLKHVANAEAKTAFWNIANPEKKKTMDYTAVPHAVFSDPQIASAGITEQQAQADNVDYVVGRTDYAGTAYGWAMEDTSSFAKVLIDATNKKILGVHIIGPQAATLIQPILQAMRFGQTAEDIAKNVFYIHPALTEVVENALLTGLEALDRG